MGDISHNFGSDIDLSATGDFLYVTGDALAQQRIIKRIVTAAGAYLQHLDYGGGARQFIGQPTKVAAIANVVRAQIFQEATVAQLPEPVVSVTEQDNGETVCTISYYDAATGQPNVLTLPIGG